jgi:hypothetical protein
MDNKNLGKYSRHNVLKQTINNNKTKEKNPPKTLDITPCTEVKTLYEKYKSFEKELKNTLEGGNTSCTH